MTNEQTHKLSEAHETQHQTNVCLAHLVLLINCGPARQMRTAPAAAAPAAPAAAELPTYTRPFYRTLKAGISFAVAIYTIVIGLPAVLLAVGLFAAGFERWWLGCPLCPTKMPLSSYLWCMHFIYPGFAVASLYRLRFCYPALLDTWQKLRTQEAWVSGRDASGGSSASS